MTNAALRGKPDAGNPHVRFDEGEVAPATTPRRGSLLYKVKVVVVLLFSFATCALLAEVGHQEQMRTILGGFSSTNYWERMNTTNKINLLMMATTNGDELADCKLLKSAVLLERAEIEHDGKARDEATNLLWSIEGEYSARQVDWRFFGVRLVLMQSLALSEDYTRIHSLATNTIPIAPTSDFERATNVWSALFGPEIPSKVSLKDAFRFNAADALLSIDTSADVYALTNGLPAEMAGRLEKIHSK